MKKFLDFYHYLEHFILCIYQDYWVKLDPGIKGAVIGAFIAIIGIFIQDKQQRDRDKEQQKSNEQNKLRYLNYLIHDTYNVIDSFNDNSKKIVSLYERNPFIIADFNVYPPATVNIIANKINQEEYYLASVNQIKDHDVAELLFMYNTLYKQQTEVTNYFESQRSHLINEKEVLNKALNDLRESVTQYLIKEGSNTVAGDEKIIYDELNLLMQNVMKSRYDSFNDWMLDSKNRLTNKIITILTPKGQLTHRALLLQATSVNSLYDQYIVRITNIVNGIKTNQEMMNSLRKKIQTSATPLDTYIADLNSKGK